jgi:[histone H3]-lysine4 N-trimethyltransferase SETD1
MLSAEGSRKRKRSSPFRVKTGSIVAFRIGGVGKSFDITVSQSPDSDQGNNGGGHSQQSISEVHVDFSDKALYATVWTNPIPHRDLYWSLVGKRVRCSLLLVEPCSGNGGQETTKHNGILEGEVIRIRKAEDHPTLGASTDSRDYPNFHVDLLVDAKSVPAHPLLKAIHCEDYIIGDSSNLKEAARRSLELELQVARGGANKDLHLVVIPVVLRNPTILDMSGALDSKKPADSVEVSGRDAPVGYDKEDVEVFAQNWVMQKSIPLHGRSNAKLPSSRHFVRDSDGSMEKKMNGNITSAVCVNGGEQIPGASNADNQESGNKRCMGKDLGTRGRDSAISNDKGGDRIMANGHSASHKLQMEISRDDSLKSNDTLETKKNANLTKLTRLERNPAPLQYFGDSNDSQNQQMQNWRWLASRYHDLLFRELSGSRCSGNWNGTSSVSSRSDSFHIEVLSAGFIGEVLKVDPDADPLKTLAMVTLRRMFLPEHTKTGRMNCHAWNDVLLDHDSSVASPRYSVLIVIPIEQLVVVSRQILSPLMNGNKSGELFYNAVIRYSYSWTEDILVADPRNARNAGNMHYCHRCRRLLDESTGAFRCGMVNCRLTIPRLDSDQPIMAWCKICLDTLEIRSDYERKVSTANCVPLPCCGGLCDCCRCTSDSDSYFQGVVESKCVESGALEPSIMIDLDTMNPNVNPLSFCASYIRSFVDSSSMKFSLPSDLVRLESLPLPRSKPFRRSVRKTGVSDELRLSRVEKSVNVGTPAHSSKSSTKKRNAVVGDVDRDCANSTVARDVLVLKRNRCAREIVYKPSKKYSFRSHDGDDVRGMRSSEKPRSLRGIHERSVHLITEQKDDSAKVSISSRAARVTQRRLLKDVASFGSAASSYLGLFDTLTNREAQLRFDRSKIHAWGVFADAAISAGEMIVEYRGELIGNAVAERREIEYEAAKIGSDYMFRIDSFIVCDATKQGNVSRFINASCDPNCYTKIITFDGTKRIVIYAKKDVEAGDELCYDYKFPLEYDEAKRIPCHCRARDCRGYMNWVRKDSEFNLRLGYCSLRFLFPLHVCRTSGML